MEEDRVDAANRDFFGIILQKLCNSAIAILSAKEAMCAMIVGLLIVRFVIVRKKDDRPPGPWPWPIVGNLPSLVGGQLPHVSLFQLSKSFGDLMFLRLGCVPCVVISSAEMAKEVFTMNDQNASSRGQGMFVEIMTGYQSLSAAPYGPHWRHLRKICSAELFSQKRVAAYQIARTEEMHELLKAIFDASREKSVINLRESLTVMSRNNMTRMLLKKRYFVRNDEGSVQQGQRLDHLMSLIFEQAATFIISDFVPYLLFATKLSGYEKKLRKTRQDSFDVCAAMIGLEKHRQRKGCESRDYVPDFVDLLMSMPSEDRSDGLSDETITFVMLDMLIAGSETTAITIEWALAELLRAPDLLKQAQAELDSVISQDRPVQEADLEQLPYLQAIVKETFRLHPAVPLGLPREFIEPCQLAGYKFPAKTRLILNLWAIHRDPNAYDRPHEFDPNRFLQHPEINVLNYCHYQLMPFGAGRRICPGLTLAVLIVTSTLAHLLHSFDWYSEKSNQNPEDLNMSESSGLTTPRKNALLLTAKPRKSPSYFEMLL
ncbi:hypothetical protein O6H91_16G049500 [Diphasiastrum complanatum]|uniref:Uncharacterized protein n=1 Tax=Diphasiastrum complanatum TaxID=34168 RepID=A0ACC2BD41_DIPCM|nr:hypothetical protein O6H91_16G049500 [Diphasiastrum complanatum]